MTTTALCDAICIGEPGGLPCVLPKGHPGIIHRDLAHRTWGMTREERGVAPHPLVEAAQRDDGTDLLEAFSGLIGDAVAGALDSYADSGSSDSGSSDSGSDYSGGGGESGGGGSSDGW